MKKFFQAIGIISLLCFSFIYTEKTVTVVKEFDDIMIEIKKINESYQVLAVDATVTSNTIIPGISGSEIDIDKSYSKMKRYGKYNEKLLEYKTVSPNVSLSNNIDKYVIGGNKEKKMVSLLFLVESNDSVTEILKILSDKKVKATFFVDGNWVEKNNDALIQIINEGHEIGNLGYNYSYTNSSFSWLDNKIKKVSGQKYGYCYNEEDNEQTLLLCSMNSNYTMRPNIIVKENPTITVKGSLSAGSFISLPVNDEVIEELPVILNFIYSKGFSVTTLSIHLQE